MIAFLKRGYHALIRAASDTFTPCIMWSFMGVTAVETAGNWRAPTIQLKFHSFHPWSFTMLTQVNHSLTHHSEILAF